MDLAIKDYVIPQEPLIAKRVNIQVVSMIFNERVTLQVLLYNKPDEFKTVNVEEKFLVIEGEEYTAWGNDDTYLENLVLQKLGLEKADS
jgi:hypothetical protein